MGVSHRPTVQGALAAFEAGNYEAAFAELERAVTDSPEALRLITDARLVRRCLPDALGAIEDERQGRHALAAANWKRVVEADPDWTWAWGRLWACVLWLYAKEGVATDLLHIKPPVSRPADALRKSLAEWSGLIDL